MRWDFHSISQQESVLVDFHRQSNLPVTEIPNQDSLSPYRGKALNSFFKDRHVKMELLFDRHIAAKVLNYK